MNYTVYINEHFWAVRGPVKIVLQRAFFLGCQHLITHSTNGRARLMESTNRQPSFPWLPTIGRIVGPEKDMSEFFFVDQEIERDSLRHCP